MDEQEEQEGQKEYATGGVTAPTRASYNAISIPTLNNLAAKPYVAPRTDVLAGSPKYIPMHNDHYENPSDSILPFGISAAASAIGDIAGLINTKRNMPATVSLPRMTSPQINLQPQREALQRSYNTANNIMLRNSRDVSSPANAYSNEIAGLTGLTDSLGTQMGQSYMGQETTNAQISQKNNEVNADLATKEALTNAQLRGQRVNTTNQYINSLSQTIPMALRDYRQQTNETNMNNLMGKDYGLYSNWNPNMNSWQKFINNLTGNKYSVVNRFYANQHLV
jgi:hypothetical protein